MKILSDITPATRLSVALAFVTMSVLLLAGAIGMIPGHAEGVRETRLRLTEALALQLTLTTRHGDEAAIESIADSVLDRYGQVQSMAVRRINGDLMHATPEHEALWGDPDTKTTVSDRVQIPLFHGADIWGTAEFCFEPAGETGFLGHGMRLALFVSFAGFVLYRLYLRKVLSYLDPSNVIPERVKLMLDTMAEGVIVLDKRERIVLANDAFISATGLTMKTLQGQNASHIPWLPAEPEAELPMMPWEMPSEERRTAKGFAVRLRCQGDDPRIFMVNTTPILGGDGSYRGTLATFDDMTDIEEKNARLEQMVRELRAVRTQVERQNDELRTLATRDALTGSFNRRALFEKFDEEWSTSQRYGHGLSCIMLDIDHFKSINDNHGHSVGDQVLQRFVAVLNRETRNTDIVGRYGGEEFCVLLPHTDVAAAAEVAEKLRAAIEAQPMADLQITASLGVSSQGLGADSPQTLIDEADRALYAAKHGGRNRVARWDEMPDESEISAHAEEHAEVSDDTPHVPIPYHAVSALMSALSQRDASTAAHSRRVADLCMCVAEGLMTAGDSFVLEVAAMLHDIGKIGVPDAILLKPGPLTDEEWEVMETHDRIGIEIINSAFHCPELTNIVMHHHAGFGGDARDPGLPTGHDIPLRARILTVVDAYDAMVSDRVYRSGMSQEDAFAELRRCAGTQFDPELVERFIHVVAARDAGRRPAEPSAPMEVMLRLGIASERLAAALESSDFKSLTAMAGRLSAVATRNEWNDIASLASDLSASAKVESDVTSLVQQTRDLLDLCHSTQGEFIERSKAGTPPPSPGPDDAPSEPDHAQVR